MCANRPELHIIKHNLHAASSVAGIGLGSKGLDIGLGLYRYCWGLYVPFGLLRIPAFCPHTTGLALSFTVSMSRDIVLS